MVGYNGAASALRASVLPPKYVLPGPFDNRFACLPGSVPRPKFRSVIFVKTASQPRDDIDALMSLHVWGSEATGSGGKSQATLAQARQFSKL